MIEQSFSKRKFFILTLSSIMIIGFLTAILMQRNVTNELVLHFTLCISWLAIGAILNYNFFKGSSLKKLFKTPVTKRVYKATQFYNLVFGSISILVAILVTIGMLIN